MFLLEKKCPIETDIIVDILKSERISYKLKSIKHYDLPWNEPRILGYDIEIHSDLEHFDYAQKLIKQRMENINKLESCFDKPFIKKQIPEDMPKTFYIGQLNVVEYKPKKSLLKCIIDWIKYLKKD